MQRAIESSSKDCIDKENLIEQEFLGPESLESSKSAQRVSSFFNYMLF